MSVFFAPSTDGRIWKADIYVRTAHADIIAIQSQVDYLVKFIKGRKDLCAHKIYVDDGCSGMTFNRPGFQGMMKDLRSKSADCVVVKDLPRLGRDIFEVAKLVDQVFPRLGVRFLSARDNVDSLLEYPLYGALLRKGGVAI